MQTIWGVALGMLCSASVLANDLLSVYHLAAETDPQLRAEGFSREAVLELRSQARAQFLPEIQLSADASRIKQETKTEGQGQFGGDVIYNDYGYTLDLRQPIYRAENWVIRDQAELQIDSANASYALAEQALIVRVAERYFDVLAKQDDLTFAQAEQEAIAKQLEQTEQRFEVGLATITDLTEAQAAFDLADAAVIFAQNALDNSREALRETTGLYHSSLAPLAGDSPLVSPEPRDIEAWTEVALMQSPLLAMMRSEVQLARAEIERQKSGHQPSLDAVLRHGYNRQTDSLFGRGARRTDNDAIGLQLTVPIYSGGVVVSRTREAGHRLDQSMQNEEEMRRMVMRETRAAFNSVMSGIRRVSALQKAVESNEKALESTEAGFDVGTRTTVDVLNARRELFSARRDLAQARYDYIVNSLRLKQAAGTVGIDDLLAINQWLAG